MGKKYFFACASMMVFLEDRQYQVPSLRAIKWKEIFLVSHLWWFFSKIDNVKSLHKGQVNGKKNYFAFTSMVVFLEDIQCQVPSLRASKWKKFFFAFTSIVVFPEDRQCQVPSRKASEWEKKNFFAITSMVVFLEDRQCQVPPPRASKWKKNFFCFHIHGGLFQR